MSELNLQSRQCADDQSFNLVNFSSVSVIPANANLVGLGQVFRLLLLATLVLMPTEVFAQDLTCGAFRRNLRGSWSAQRLVTLQGPKGPISLMRGRTFRHGEYYKGLNVVALLEQNCR